MTHHIWTVVLAAGLAGIAAPPAAQTTKPAATRKARLAWPPAVEAAFLRSYPGDTVKSVSKEVEHGKTIYEVESTENGRRRDINYNPDGSLILYEEELTPAEIPAAVLTAITKRYPKATATSGERLYKVSDKSSNFEVRLKGAAVGEVVLAADGSWISPRLK